jgi:uncharacterized protein with PIN domain
MSVSDSGKNIQTAPDPERNYWPGGADEVLGTLENGTKVKRRMLRMRACTERDAKGKMCRGHLKRWYEPPEALARRFGKDAADAYRCERCKTIYLPNAIEAPRTQTMVW